MKRRSEGAAPDGRERRVYAVGGIELRAAGEGEAPRVAGHAAVFNEWSEELGGFRERIHPGAFADSLSGDIRALFNHNTDIVLGRTKAGTLSLAEDDRGLAFELTPPDTQAGRDLLVSLQRGDIDQMSFAFLTREQRWEKLDEEVAERTLIKVELIEISPVSWAAYPQTDVAVRSLEALRAEGDAEAARRAAEETRRRMRLRLAGA